MASAEKPEELQPPEAEEEGMIVKPHCECAACDSWSKTVDWCPPSALQFECKRTKNRTEKVLKPLMRSERHPGKAPKVQTYNPKGLTRVERQTVFKTLVQGEIIPEPVEMCKDTYFGKDVQKSLEKLNYHYSKPVQSFAWPAVFRMMNVFVIGEPQCGKTLSYLPALCTFSTTVELRYEELAKHKGPKFIIICPSSKQCEEVFDLIRLISKDHSVRPRVSIVTYPVSYIHSTDILITIPETLIHCLKTRIFNFKALCHLVLEDASTLLLNHERSIYKILEVIDEMLEHRATNTKVQLIATSEKWSSDLKKLLESVYTTPLVCIGNHLEAALYGNINFEIKFLMTSQKLDHLECLLKDKFSDYKTVVVCNQSEIAEVSKWLVRAGIRTLALSENSSKEEIEQYELEWNFSDSGLHKVLLCTDLILESLLCINSAMWLIHYSFASTWTRFTRRFSAVSAYLKSPLDSNKDEVQCKSVVLIDETCEEEMPRILNLLNRLTKDLPAKYQKYGESFRDKAENEKIVQRVDLCPSLKLFGKCRDSLLCEKRHLLSPDSDVSESLPKSGKIKFRVLDMRDVTQFSVQLLEHIDIQGGVKKFDDVDLRQPLEYPQDFEMRRALNLKVGQFCAHCEYTTKGEVYMLCHVASMTVNSVEVKLQTGLSMQTTRSRLFEVPPNLTIVDVYLCNLLPPFEDSSFSGRSFRVALTSLQKQEYRKMTLTGQIYLQLCGSLWLDEVVQMSKVDGTEVIRFDLFRHLTRLNVVTVSTSQISSLNKLCKRCDIALPTYLRQRSVKKSAKKQDVEARRAFLDENIHEVILSCAYSPDEFYVRLAKFQSLLDNLQKGIAKAIETDILDRNLKVEIGRYYLAPDRLGDTYARVRVVQVEDSRVLCFHVDYGDECVVDISTLKVLPTRLLTRLPFQAIQCRLYGLAPSFGEWDDEATDILYRYMFEPDSDVFRALFVEMRAKDDGDMTRALMKYSVSLKDGFEERQVLINQLLLDCGLATSIFDRIDDFEIPQPPPVEESSDEDAQLDGEVRQTGVDEEGDDEFAGPVIDVEIIDVEEFIEMLTGVNARELCMRAVQGGGDGQTTAPERPIDAQRGDRGPVAETRKEERPSHLTPEVFWSQTGEIVRLKIKVIGVEDYKTNVLRKKIFSFSATVSERPYRLSFTLHAGVTLERHRASGQEVLIVLKKLETSEWPQLTNSARRMRNIHYEIPEYEKEPPKRKFLQLDVTDEESSEDDGVMYVVSSDLDSDYDYELPNSDSDTSN